MNKLPCGHSEANACPHCGECVICIPGCPAMQTLRTMDSDVKAGDPPAEWNEDATPEQ